MKKYLLLLGLISIYSVHASNDYWIYDARSDELRDTPISVTFKLGRKSHELIKVIPALDCHRLLKISTNQNSLFSFSYSRPEADPDSSSYYRMMPNKILCVSDTSAELKDWEFLGIIYDHLVTELILTDE